MKEKREYKIEKMLDSEELAAFLRALAAEIEGGNEGNLKDYGVDLHDFNKIKLGLKKKEGGALTLKLRITDKVSQTALFANPVQVEPEENNRAPEDVVKYKTLKKRLKLSFAAIKKQVIQGQKPALDVCQEFFDDAKAMTGFPGFGDEYYSEFDRLRKELEKALAANDVAFAHQLCRDMDQVKKDCHKKYK